MTTRKRFIKTLTNKPVDRVPFMKVFGGTNCVLPRWEEEYPGIGECIDDLLQFEGTYRGWDAAPVNVRLSQRGTPKELERKDNEYTREWEDGTVEVIYLTGDYHYHALQWPVRSQSDWDRVKKRHLQIDDPERFPDDWTDYIARYRARDYPLQLTSGGVYGFAREMMGDEALGYAFYDAPELVHDIMDTYTEVLFGIWEKMLADVDFDLIECWEDMASNKGSLISPKIFKEFMAPNYRRIREFATQHGIEILLVDSDGYIEELSGWMLDAGVNVIYPFEVEAGNDVESVLERYPNIGVIGGLRKNAMAMGKDAMEQELEKAQRLIRKGRCIPGPDHFVLSNVSFENYRYFMERLREIVMTTQPGE